MGTLIGVIAASSTWWLEPPTDATQVVIRFQHLLPEGQNFTRTGRHVLALSPDGTKLVYVANQQLYVRQMNALESQPIGGTNEDPFEPVFSPDGAWVAYFVPARGAGSGLSWTLKKIAITGGSPITVAQLPGLPFGLSWDAGMILLAMNSGGASGVQAVPEGGGPPTMLVAVDPKKEMAEHPQLLKDGKHVLFVVRPRVGSGGESKVVVQPISGGDRRVLITGGTDPRVLPTGHLLYSNNGTLFAVPFDAERLSVTAGPVPVVDGLSWSAATGRSQFTIASNGTLAFRPGDALRNLVWVDRQGRQEPLTASPGGYIYPRLSPDGTKVAITSVDEERDIWVFDLAKETLTRMTFGPAADLSAVWTPDGRHLVFASGANYDAVPRDIFRTAADGTGTPEALTQNLTGGLPLSISPDQRLLLFRRGTFDLFVLPLEPGAQPRPLLAGAGYQELNGELSPDGRWIAYQSDESGRQEIYVRPFPHVDGGRWQISSAGGTRPLWARSGRELFYASAGNRLVAVPITAGSSFSSGSPQPLFDAYAYLTSGGVGRVFDISPDGQRFLMTRSVGDAPSARPGILIVTNWFEELKRLVPTN